MNAGTSVQKDLSPEEGAILANIAGLITQLQSGGNPHAEPDLDNQGGPSDNDADNNPGVMKGSEQGRTQDESQSVMDPKAEPKEKGMADWNDEEVKKAFATIAKSIQTSDTEGVTANDNGEERAEELADTDEKTVNEVAKALLKLAGKKSVAKSMNSAQTPDLTPILNVMKNMDAKINQQGQVIAEMLSGYQAAAGVTPVQTVQKSQNAPFNGGNMVETIASVVAKSMLEAGAFRQSDSGIPVAKGFTRTEADNGQAIRGFAEAITHDASFAENWNLPH